MVSARAQTRKRRTYGLPVRAQGSDTAAAARVCLRTDPSVTLRANRKEDVGVSKRRLLQIVAFGEGGAEEDLMGTGEGGADKDLMGTRA